MASKKTVLSQVGSALGAAAARVESVKPKRAANAKHTKAQTPVIQEKKEVASEQLVSEPRISEREDIEITAYLYAKARAFQGGSPDEDWLRAEQEVRVRRAAHA